MRNVSIFMVLAATFSVSLSAGAQTQDEEVSEQSFKDVFGPKEGYGVSRSSNFTKHKLELPEDRDEWLAIAAQIEKGEIDEDVVYAMYRGDPPTDIITPELRATYDAYYEDWLLEKWGDQNPNPVRTSFDELVTIAQYQPTLPSQEKLDEFYQLLMDELSAQKQYEPAVALDDQKSSLSNEGPESVFQRYLKELKALEQGED